VPEMTTDVAKAELDALRKELLTRSQAEGTAVSAALTVVAAVGGFALAKKQGRLEMLLVLPLVLSGLGLLLTRGVHGNRLVACYIREHLWPRLGATETDDAYPSWEHFIDKFRKEHTRFSVYALLNAIPVALIFVVPSIASLAVTLANGHLGSLWWLWGAGVFSIVAFVVLAWMSRPTKTPCPPRSASGPSEGLPGT
jgi:hypothetical protein